MVNPPDIDKIAFTGSTEVGRIIRKATAGSGKKLSLELGGKSPFIVFDDADLDSVVEGVVDAIWFNQGQVCCAGSRLLVHEGIAGRLVTKLRARMERLRVGPPLDKAIDMGAIVAPVQLERIRSLVNTGVEEGATMWQPSWACPTDGYFYPPTLFTNVSPAATIAQVEIFGPVLVSMTFRTPVEAVELANNTPYGLAASVWTENINLALDVAPKIKAGVVWINCTNLFDAASGFGGYRESGFGREGGKEGMWEYVKRDAGSGKREAKKKTGKPARAPRISHPASRIPPIDRTYKLFIGGAQVPRSGLQSEDPGAVGRALGRGRGGEPQGHPQCGRGGARRGRLGEDERPQSRPGPVLSRREPGAACRRIRGADLGDDGSRSGRRTPRSGREHLAPLLLRRLGRQVRRGRPPDPDSGRDARHERAHRRDRHRLPRSGAPVGVRIARGSGRGGGQHGDRDPLGGASPGRDGAVHGARCLGHPRRRDQHSHRGQGCARQGARGA